MSATSVNRETYIFEIDKFGDISASLERYIRTQESYASAICLDVTDEGMRPFKARRYVPEFVYFE